MLGARGVNRIIAFRRGCFVSGEGWRRHIPVPPQVQRSFHVLTGNTSGRYLEFESNVITTGLYAILMRTPRDQ
jgi:hypothetical protein